MNAAIIAYDLKNVRAEDNERVKKALAEFCNTFDGVSQLSPLAPLGFPLWIERKLPDTTLWVAVVDSISPEQIGGHVKEVIESVGAEPGRIYVAIIGPDWLWNAPKP